MCGRARASSLRVTANAASWQAAANSYTSYVTAAQQRTQQMSDVRQLASGRFPWSLLLSQIGGVMPANSALSNLSATSPSADSVAATAAASGASSSPTSTNVSAVQLSGCAASQSAVAATMVALRRVQGVGSVSLASTSYTGTPAGGSGSSSGQNTGGCPFPVTFQMSLELVSATPATASGSTTPGAAPPAGSSAATPAATPTASANTTSTGAAQ